jgi:tRNA threonylcarbamoyl adenosine modification protein YeaZ
VKILTIDTTGSQVHVILQRAGDIIDDLEVATRNGHAELLLPTVERLLGRNGLSCGSVDCFAALNGPGSFVGLRVSVAFLKALRCARPGIKIILNSIFQVLAFRQSYDFVVLGAGVDGFYIYDREQHSFYIRRERGRDFLSIGSRIITNSPDAMDFLKSPNIIARQVGSREVAALNHFRCVNEQFSEGRIEPVYIREPQVNTKNG